MRTPRAVGRLLLVVVVGLTACAPAESEISIGRAPVPSAPTDAPPDPTVASTETVPTTAAPPPASSTTVEAPATTPAPTAPPVPAAESAEVVARVRPAAWTLEPYQGLGAWLDVFDWSTAFARSPDDVVGTEALDRMAAEGVTTVYLQTSRWNSESDLVEPDRLRALIDHAHARNMAVVAWYLPTLEDPALDLRRLLAAAALDVDGLAVDIEARQVADVEERNRRLVQLSADLRAQLPGKVIGGIVLEPVVMEDVNPDYWPGYPWLGLAPHYDVWLPMSYWTNRRGAWRDAYTYSATNVRRVRERLGDPDALVHLIGGIGDETTVADLDGMILAARETGVIGGSIYDYRTTRDEHWSRLHAFR